MRKLFKQKVEETRLLRRMPDDLKALFEGMEEEREPDLHPLQPRQNS